MRRIAPFAAALALLLSLAAGCSGPKEDEATRKYQGPGRSRPGAPSAAAGGGMQQTR